MYMKQFRRLNTKNKILRDTINTMPNISTEASLAIPTV